MRSNSTRLKKLEARRERLCDLEQMTDDELFHIIADGLGIPVDVVANFTDEQLEKIATTAASDHCGKN